MSAGTLNSQTLDADQVLAIAFRDARRVYENLKKYRVQVALESDGWHVDFELTQPGLFGGGPNYVIDPDTGAILHKQYEQ